MVRLQLVPRIEADHCGELRGDLTALSIGAYRCRGAAFKENARGATL